MSHDSVTQIGAAVLLGPAGQWLMARIKDILARIGIPLNPWIARALVLTVVYPLVLALNKVTHAGLTYTDAETLVETAVAGMAALTSYHLDTPASVPNVPLLRPPMPPANPGNRPV
jgi:hypothetical protein